MLQNPPQKKTKKTPYKGNMGIMILYSPRFLKQIEGMWVAMGSMGASRCNVRGTFSMQDVHSVSLKAYGLSTKALLKEDALNYLASS